MAQQFNLTAQINLQSPKNVGKVVSDIQRQLKGSGLNTVNIKVKADPRTMAQTNRQLQNVGKNAKNASRDIGILNRNLQESARRFSVITLATGGMLALVTGLKNATKAAIEFERELIKISQVTGKSVQNLKDLTREVTKLSTSLGVSSADLLTVSRTLAQAGFSAEKTRKALDILAKTSLGATFGKITETTEVAIAVGKLAALDVVNRARVPPEEKLASLLSIAETKFVRVAATEAPIVTALLPDVMVAFESNS